MSCKLCPSHPQHGLLSSRRGATANMFFRGRHQIYFEKIHPSVPMIHKYRYLAAMNL